MNPEYIAELGPDLFISPATAGTMNVTRNRYQAQKYNTRNAAWDAIDKMQKRNPGKFKRGWVAVAARESIRK